MLQLLPLSRNALTKCYKRPGSYCRKKRVVIILIPILHNLLSYTPQFIRRKGMVIKGLKRGRNLRGFGCPYSVPIGKSPIAWDKRTEKHIGFLCSPFSFI